MLKRLTFAALLILCFFALTMLVGGVQSQADALPPLNEPGPYGVLLTKMTFTDESRGDWQLETRLWYPGDKTQGTPTSATSPVLKSGPPDRSGAPYPLIIFSHGWTGTSSDFGKTKTLLASHGYVIAAPQHHDNEPYSHVFVDRPLDIMTVLNGLAAIGEGDMAGMIDTNNVGLMGYSSGGAAVFQMLGLLSDPVHVADRCAEYPALSTEECMYQGALEDTIAYRAQLGLQDSTDGRWMPFGDERIRAVMAMDPCEFELTSEDMLASVFTPTMILHGTNDPYCDYEGNAVRSYSYLGTEDRYLISLVSAGHFGAADFDTMQHFATAFFGKYLQGDAAYDPYLTPENLPDWTSLKLVWGPYGGD